MGDKSILNQPIKVGNLVFKNRIMMPAMGTGMAGINGEVTHQMIEYYEERACGGAGAIIMEITCVDNPIGRAGFTQLCIDKPQYLAGLRELSEAIQSHGCCALIQLHHAGRQTMEIITGEQPVAPSPVACRFMRSEPRELDIEGINRIRNKFVAAALFAQQAGFNGIELHAAHGYLLSQFLSPYTNRRCDEYGGNTEKRVRLLHEIIGDIKRMVPGFIVGVRFNVCDFVPGGIEVEEGIKIARLLEKAGADLLNVSCGIYESGQMCIEPASFDEAWRISLAAAVKKEVKIPVVGGGVIRHPETAEKILASKQADLVWVGRGMIADPCWAEKATSPKKPTIRPCISCNTCIDTVNKGLHLRCTVNPMVGREHRLRKSLNINNIKVMVIGGGPAGIQAALSLDKAGCSVVLVEKGKIIGGQLNIAGIPPYKDKLVWLKEYLVKEIGKSDVKLQMETEFTEKLLDEYKPDVLVIATGARPIMPEIPGINSTAVSSFEKVLDGSLLLEGKQVLIIGGGSVGCEVAEYLALHNNSVTIIEKERQIAMGVENMTRLELLQRLKKAGIKTRRGFIPSLIDGNKVYIKKVKNNSEEVLEADNVILACGYRSQDMLAEAVGAKVRKVYVIGDALKPRSIGEAIYEGEMVAHNMQFMINNNLL